MSLFCNGSMTMKLSFSSGMYLTGMMFIAKGLIEV